jgi:hypothetical protein
MSDELAVPDAAIDPTRLSGVIVAAGNYGVQKNCKLRNDTAKVLLHALCIRGMPGEQLECSDCLPYRHAAAVEVAAAAFPRCAQPFGLQRKINDLCDPLPGLDPSRIDRGPGMAGHADRRCVDHAVGRGDRRAYVAGVSHRAAPGERDPWIP